MERVVEKEAANGGRAVAIEVDGGSPGRAVRAGEEIAAERRQIGALGSEVVVDDIDEDAETGGVSVVDEGAEIIRPAIRARRREERGAVVSPVPTPGKIGERHQLDRRDPQVAQVLEAFADTCKRSTLA